MNTLFSLIQKKSVQLAAARNASVKDEDLIELLECELEELEFELEEQEAEKYDHGDDDY